MLIPTDKEMQEALDEAERMRGQNDDPNHMARALLYLNRRNGFLEDVNSVADRYIRFGQEEHEHAELVLAIEKARSQEQHDFGMESDKTGL